MMEAKDKYQNNTFSKEERLCGTKSIDRLFASGNSFISYPLRIVYILDDEADSNQQSISVLISVSKRKFKRAVKRNRVKRLIREGYRLNKSEYFDLLHTNNKSLDIAFLYLKDELPTFSEIEKSIKKAAVMLNDRIEKGGKE